MKEIMISIKPKWCAKIANGEKTIEVRKNHPKIEMPFKCYIYCTKGGETIARGISGKYSCLSEDNFINGKVIGEFVCDRIDVWAVHSEYGYICPSRKDWEGAGLSLGELENYGNGKILYGWHISNLKIYDKPKEVSEFGVRLSQVNNWCYVSRET